MVAPIKIPIKVSESDSVALMGVRRKALELAPGWWCRRFPGDHVLALGFPLRPELWPTLTIQMRKCRTSTDEKTHAPNLKG